MAPAGRVPCSRCSRRPRRDCRVLTVLGGPSPRGRGERPGEPAVRPCPRPGRVPIAALHAAGPACQAQPAVTGVSSAAATVQPQLTGRSATRCSASMSPGLGAAHLLFGRSGSARGHRGNILGCSCWGGGGQVPGCVKRADEHGRHRGRRRARRGARGRRRPWWSRGFQQVGGHARAFRSARVSGLAAPCRLSGDDGTPPRGFPSRPTRGPSWAHRAEARGQRS